MTLHEELVALAERLEADAHHQTAKHRRVFGKRECARPGCDHGPMPNEVVPGTFSREAGVVARAAAELAPPPTPDPIPGEMQLFEEVS